jgi:hypothetical protein
MTSFQVRDGLIESGGEKCDESRKDDDTGQPRYDGSGLDVRERVFVLAHIARIGELEKDDPDLLGQAVLNVRGERIEDQSEGGVQQNRGTEGEHREMKKAELPLARSYRLGSATAA